MPKHYSFSAVGALICSLLLLTFSIQQNPVVQRAFTQPNGDFSIFCPSTIVAPQGRSTDFVFCNVTALDGFSASVSFSSSGLPSGVTTNLDGMSVVPTSTGTQLVFRLNIGSSTAIGNHVIGVVGTGGGKTN